MYESRQAHLIGHTSSSSINGMLLSADTDTFAQKVTTSKRMAIRRHRIWSWVRFQVWYRGGLIAPLSSPPLRRNSPLLPTISSNNAREFIPISTATNSSYSILHTHTHTLARATPQSIGVKNDTSTRRWWWYSSKPLSHLRSVFVFSFFVMWIPGCGDGQLSLGTMGWRCWDGAQMYSCGTFVSNSVVLRRFWKYLE